MPRLTGKPTTGRLITLGREPLGQFARRITAFEQVVGYSRCHFASFADNADDSVPGGARLTASACRIVIGMLIKNIETGGRDLPVQWPTLSTDYEAAKEKFVGGLGQWRLTDRVVNSIGVQKRWGEAGRSVGIFGNPWVPKINFAAMRGGSPTKKIRVSTYVFWNEFGTWPTHWSGGQPPRPVFIPTYQQFARKYLPKLADAICESLEDDFKRLAKNIGKIGGKGLPGPGQFIPATHIGEIGLPKLGDLKDEFKKVSNKIAAGVGISEAKLAGLKTAAELAKAEREAAKKAAACEAKAKGPKFIERRVI